MSIHSPSQDVQTAALSVSSTVASSRAKKEQECIAIVSRYFQKGAVSVSIDTVPAFMTADHLAIHIQRMTDEHVAYIHSLLIGQRGSAARPQEFGGPTVDPLPTAHAA